MTTTQTLQTVIDRLNRDGGDLGLDSTREDSWRFTNKKGDVPLSDRFQKLVQTLDWLDGYEKGLTAAKTTDKPVNNV